MYRASSTWSDYKQVGAFFFQTDGPELYAGSTAHDVFYHTNDDTIKIYYSNVAVRRVVVWKGHNDPVIQMGWASKPLNLCWASAITQSHSYTVRPPIRERVGQCSHTVTQSHSHTVTQSHSHTVRPPIRERVFRMARHHNRDLRCVLHPARIQN